MVFHCDSENNARRDDAIVLVFRAATMIHGKSRIVIAALLAATGLWTASWAFELLSSADEAADDVRLTDAAEVKSLHALEQRLNEAIVQGDVATFDELLAEDFTHTSQDGRFRTRAEWMKGRIQGQTNYLSYEVADLQIRLYGACAIATGLSKPSWRESDGSPASGRYRFLRVWAKREGHWRAVA